MKLTKEKLAAFLRDQLFVDEADLSPDALIFSDGIVDSFSLLELIQFVEQSEGITLSPEEVTLENFDSISRIIRFLSER